MIELVIAFDEQDITLGNFFHQCVINIKALLNVPEIIIHEMNSKMIKNNIFSENKLAAIAKPLLFFSFTHGTENSLLGSSDSSFIDLDTDKNCFTDSFSYCFSCSAGKVLGETIIEKGGRCFVGHNGTIYGHNYDKWNDIFIAPIKTFVSEFKSGETISVCIKNKKKKYTDIIDSIYSQEFLIASCLLNNRDSLILHGDETCTLHDFANT